MNQIQADLSPDTSLFAGRYIVAETTSVHRYGFTYKAFDRSTDSRVFIHEFFPHTGCMRNPETLDMSIRKEAAAEVSTLYREFTRYVTALMNGNISGGQQLIHAFKDHGTAFYVTADDDTDMLQSGNRTAKPRPEPPAAAPTTAPLRPVSSPRHAAAQRSTPARREETPARAKAETQERTRNANYRNAILWYRIVIFLLLCIVLLLVYLTFLSPSPRVKSAHSAKPTPTEASAQPTSLEN